MWRNQVELTPEGEMDERTATQAREREKELGVGIGVSVKVEKGSGVEAERSELVDGQLSARKRVRSEDPVDYDVDLARKRARVVSSMTQALSPIRFHGPTTRISHARTEAPVTPVAEGNLIPVHYTPTQPLANQIANIIPPREPAAMRRSYHVPSGAPDSQNHISTPNYICFTESPRMEALAALNTFGSIGGHGHSQQQNLPQHFTSPPRGIPLDQMIQPKQQFQAKEKAQTKSTPKRKTFDVATGHPFNAYPGYDKLTQEQVPIINTLPSEHRIYIVQIAIGIFNPMDLIKFSHNNVSFTKGEEVNTSFDVFGESSEKWSRCFLRYTVYLCRFYSIQNPALLQALVNFHHRIVDLGKEYQWQSVLRLGLGWHIMMAPGVIPNAESWVLPEDVIERKCIAPLKLQKASGAGGRSGINMSADGEARDDLDRELRSKQSWEQSKEEFRMLYVVRDDLGMTKVQIVDQHGHATLSCCEKSAQKNPTAVRAWESGGGLEKIIKTGGPKAGERMKNLQNTAHSLGICTEMVLDSGEKDAERVSVLGIGPAPNSIIETLTSKWKSKKVA